MGRKVKADATCPLRLDPYAYSYLVFVCVEAGNFETEYVTAPTSDIVKPSSKGTVTTTSPNKNNPIAVINRSYLPLTLRLPEIVVAIAEVTMVHSACDIVSRQPSSMLRMMRIRKLLVMGKLRKVWMSPEV